MTQLIAAYHYDRKKLGPATARGRLNELFDEEAYCLIRNTPPPLAYQLYLLGEINDRALRRLAGKKQYICNVKGYVDLAAFACVCRILREVGVRLGKEDFNFALETEYEADEKVWEVVVKAIVDHVLENFKRVSASAMRRDGAPVSVANYFKTSSLVGELMTRPIPHKLRSIVVGRFR